MTALLAFFLAGALLAVAIAAIIYHRRLRDQSSRLRTLIDQTNGLLAASPKDRATVEPGQEINALERALSAVASEIRAVTDTLEVEASRREAILSSMGEGVLAVDKDLRAIFFNPAILRAMGVRQPVPARLSLLELVRDYEVLALLTEVIRSGTSLKRSQKIVAAGGRLFEIYAAPLEGASGGGAIAIFHDITNLDRLENIRRDFVANVSHEIRTPLASIIAYSDTLLDGALEDPEARRNFIRTIRSNAIRLNSIAADLLILSDLESGVSLGQLERVPVREVLENMSNTIGPDAQANDVHLTMAAPQELFIMGHRLRLEQALLNLLTNAVKFNRPGGEVRVDMRETTGGAVQIKISDTGIGIPSEDLSRIFERFYRVDKARSRKAGGTGLGLAIVKHAIEGMGGSVTVDSQLGKGSTFTITLRGRL